MRISTNKVQEFEKDHLARVRKYAPESMVLLKNDQVLPFGKFKTVALYGNGARETIKGGTGSGDVNVRHFTTIEEAFQNAGYTVTSKKWLNEYSKFKQRYVQDFYYKLKEENKDTGVPTALAMMGKTPLEPDYDINIDSSSKADVAVYVLARNSGEGTDRRNELGDIKLTNTEEKDIITLAKNYKNFVLILNTGGLVDISGVKDKVPAILLLSQLGSATGEAAVDVLTGKSYPSGKLTMTWAGMNEYPSTQNFGNKNDTQYKEGIYVGYRYFDSVNMPVLYEFGYGESYTTFQINVENVSLYKTNVKVAVNVKNTGKFNGKEVVQAYISKPQGKLDQPYQDLVGYQKTNELAPGESTKVYINFNFSDLASFEEDSAQEILEAGEYLLRIGNSSRNTITAAKFELDQNVVTKVSKKLIDLPTFKDFAPNVISFNKDNGSKKIKSIKVHANDFKKIVSFFDNGPVVDENSNDDISWQDVVSGKSSIEDFVATLTTEDLADLAVGNYADSGNVMEVIGNASTTVAGAAGETTHRLSKKIPILVMADGPAGLRLSTEYVLNDNGTISSVTAALSGGEKSQAANNATIYYQYATAIPIGTAIAQSWDVNIAKAYGDIVGAEMEIFDVDLWLAPALNIQRSPLDGRNFEYYSEDPLISGLTAAGITNGVQMHSGKTTTIKHYLANNQETNRYFSNSELSERALRDIYARGFEIAVDKSHPLALMTSYNLINGLHSSESKLLIQNLLRDEYGFGGLVMSDWFDTGGMGLTGDKYTSATVTGNVIAGNDMTMPGLPDNVKELIQSIKTGRLKKSDLQRNAVHILNVILKLKK